MELVQLADSALSAAVDLLAIVTFGDPSKDPTFRALDAASGGVLGENARGERFEGKPGQLLSHHTAGKLPARRVVVLGGGVRTEFKNPQIRDVSAQAAAHANKVGATSLGFVLPAVGEARAAHLMQLAAEGVLIGGYKFGKYLTGDDHKKIPSLTKVGFIADAKGGKIPAAQARTRAALLERARVIGAAINRARDLVNEPAAVVTPVALAAEAEAIAARHKGTVTVTILGPEECEALGMGMFLAVARGSEREPRFIHLTYTPTKKPKKKIALIGKGLTFDSGGYSIKPSSGMEDMKVDMAGSAAVLSAFDAIATIGSDNEIHAIAACCENLVSGRAYLLGDVLTSMDGTTVEINNTDAEGRLTLGDAITYVRTKIAPDEMFDFATLTGACMVALGPFTAGVFSDHEALAKAWLAAADRSGEDMWRLPLNSRLRDQLKSPIADMRNTGDRFGGAITAGLFLKVFAKTTPWVHVDIAGPASVTSARPSQPKGGTGYGVATMVEYAARPTK